MDRIEHIKMMNDLVLRSERGELTWDRTNYAGFFKLTNSNGFIEIGKKNNGNIIFRVFGEKGDSLSDSEYFRNKDQDLQIYKVSNVLWSLVKDLNNDKGLDFQEILDFLEEEEE